MRISKTPGYGLLEVGVWPQPCDGVEPWQIYSLKRKEDGELHWYIKYITKDNGRVYCQRFPSYSQASSFAKKENKLISEVTESLAIPKEDLESLKLKVKKAILAKSRIIEEELLMHSEAIKRNKKTQISAAKIKENFYEDYHDEFKDSVSDYLKKYPYVQFIYLPRYNSFLVLKDGWWKREYISSSKGFKISYRERIARGFGFSGLDNWSKTKAAIREILLPRANQLLMHHSIQKILSEAKSLGKKVFIINSFVFWLDEDGSGWKVKSASYSESSRKGNTLWENGTIISKNHGRIVVLPYIKENGEKVKGYTKNGPNDGNAVPRHRSEYVEVPFEISEGDLMRGLFGELPYE